MSKKTVIFATLVKQETISNTSFYETLSLHCCPLFAEPTCICKPSVTAKSHAGGTDILRL